MYFSEKCPDDDDDVVILKNWAFIEPLQIPGTVLSTLSLQAWVSL